MLLPSLPLDRLGPVLAGTRTRRAAWAGVAVALWAAVAAAQAAFALVGAPPTTGTRVLLDGATVVAVSLAYALLGRALTPRLRDPLVALWTPALLFAGLIGAYAALPLLGVGGSVEAGTGLPTRAGTAFGAALLGAAEGGAAVVLLLALRGLVLFRPTQRTVWTWRTLLGALLATALAGIGRVPTEPPPFAAAVCTAGAFALMIACAFRLAWVVPLSMKRKWGAMGLAAALGGVLVLALIVRFQGPGALPLAGGTALARESAVPIVFLFSHALGDLVVLASAFGVLYAVTTLLSLLFHLPTAGAYAQRAGEIRAFGALAEGVAELSGQALDRERLAATVAAAPVRAGIADAAWLALVRADTGTLAPVVAAAEGLAPARVEALVDTPALAADALDRAAPLVLGHAAADHRVRARPGDGLGSLLVLPLVAGGQQLGALFAARRMPDAFEPDDVEALATFAGQASLALAHADLFAEALEKERMGRELALAREVQQRLLPTHLPQLDGVELAVSERSTYEVCGDYYDVVELGEGCLGVIVADVSGKGAAAAFYMAELKGIFQSASRLTRSPGEFLARANEALGPSLRKKAFVSAVYGVLDPKAGVFTFARAGHCPVAMARDGGGRWLLRAGGIGLGLADDALFRRTLAEQEVRLEPGDAFALYTDGLVEARDGAGEEFGYERLEAALARHRHRPAERLLDALLDEQRAFAGHDRLDDDLTLLVLRWTGPAVVDPDHVPCGVPDASPTLLAEPFTIRPAFA